MATANKTARANEDAQTGAPSQPDLPPGTNIKDGQELERNRTTAVYQWTGTVEPLAARFIVGGQEVAVRPPATTTLELVATVPLKLRFDFTHESAVRDPPEMRVSLVFTIDDENGQSRCDAVHGESCEFSLKRSTKDVRTWLLRVEALVAGNVETPFTVVATIETISEA